MKSTGLVLAWLGWGLIAGAQAAPPAAGGQPAASGQAAAGPRSADYQQVQNRLARGWNTWDVHSVATQVLLPDALAIHLGMKHNSTLNGDAYLGNALIGRLDPGAEVVTPGSHAWDGSYTSADFEWKGTKWRVESAHVHSSDKDPSPGAPHGYPSDKDPSPGAPHVPSSGDDASGRSGADVVLLVQPLKKAEKAETPTVVFSVDYLWNRPGMAVRSRNRIQAHSALGDVPIYCTCEAEERTRPATYVDLPMGGPHFAAELSGPVGVSTGRARTVEEIRQIVDGAHAAYQKSIDAAGKNGPVLDAIETTLGWDTIYEPSGSRVVSPVSRVWSVSWGGYVVFDWDTFFAATMAGVGSKDLAYANALETLREETPAGFVPNYARGGGWKSFDRSEPPVGAITVLGLYRQFKDKWFLEDAFIPLLRWNRWWAEHRTVDGYIVLGSDPENEPRNPDDGAVGTWQGAVYESGLDNSPMYDGTKYDEKTHKLQYADVGMMSLYIADCEALAQIAGTLERPTIEQELQDRARQYRARLMALWDEGSGMFLNKDLTTGKWSTRLSPTNFYPLLAKAATAEQANRMIEQHLLNPHEFWGQYVIPSIARNDPAFKDQQYWRGRIWGPMNYLVYLGLRNYDGAATRKDFADRGYALFLKEWNEKRHVHENYNAVTGSGDDVMSSDRFYHWGALLGYVEWMENGGGRE